MRGWGILMGFITFVVRKRVNEMKKLVINIFIMCVAMVCKDQSQCDGIDVVKKYEVISVE